MKGIGYTILIIVVLLASVFYYFALAGAAMLAMLELVRCVWTGPVLIVLAFVLYQIEKSNKKVGG